MKGINEFIIEIGQAFNNTLEYGSLKLYTDHKTKQQEQSNRKGKVISIPAKGESEIEIDAEVIIDPTVLFEQTYNGKTQESQFIVNKAKGWYRVTPEMVLLYKNPNKENFTGHKNNLFVTPIVDDVTKIGSIYIPKSVNDQESVAKVEISNEEMITEEDINSGDHIYYNTKAEWKFNIEGEEYILIKNFHVLGKKELDNE